MKSAVYLTLVSIYLQQSQNMFATIVPKRALKLLEYRLQTFLAKDHYFESLQLYGDQIIPGQLKKRVRQYELPILTTSMQTGL